MSVLVVSNDTNIKQTITLLKREGHRVLTAQNGHDALRIIQNTPVDLVLLDTATTRRGDDDVNHHFEHNCNAAIIQLPIPGSYGKELGIDPRIVSGLQQIELLKRVRQVLAQPRQPAPTTFNQPSLREAITRNSSHRRQEVGQRPAESPLPPTPAPARPTLRQAASSTTDILTLPTPQSIMANLISLNSAATAWIYLGLLTAAEICTFIVNPQFGLMLHGFVLMLLIINAAFRWQEPIHHLLLGLTFVPLIRLLSLSLPMINLPRVYWYLIITIPLLIVAAMMLRILQYSWLEVGLNLRQIPVQILIAPTGLVFGYVYYLILKPLPLINNLMWPDILVPALIIFISTGFSEELIFRGILQRAATEFMGRSSIIYIAALYTTLHIGHRSPLNPVCAFGLSLFLGWLVYKTRSILGVTFCHGIINIMLFLVMPFIIS